VTEYQCYEFVALDRPLTSAEMAELRSISTRAQITPTRFFNEYHWGDLKADPADLLVRYFDVHVYLANWGSRRLMFRLPEPAVNLDDLRVCLPGGPATLTVTEHHVVVDLWSETEEPEDEWFEGGQLLASLTPLRAELLRGDRRVSYLAWLLAVQADELDPDTVEPPVPHGLDGPSASLAALTDFLRVDPDLLAAAAEAGIEDTGEMERFRSWVARLPAREQQRWLLRAADNLGLALGSTLLGEFRRAHPPMATDQGRTVAQLLDRAEELRAERRLQSIKRGLRPGWQTSASSPAASRAPRGHDLPGEHPR
jgi:hypothetical protein